MKQSKQSKAYGIKAQEMRDLAKRAPDTGLRDKLNNVALEYDRLADEAER